VRHSVVWLLLALPIAVGARLPILIDFTEEHSVDEVKLSSQDARAILQQLPGQKRLSLSDCTGEAKNPDAVPLLSVLQAVNGDFLRDGLGPQMLVAVLATPCEEYPRPIDTKTTLVLVRAGKVVARRSGLAGAARVELVTRLPGADRDLAVLVFRWHHMGALGAGAEIWSAGPAGLELVKDLGRVRHDSCGEASGGDIRAAVFLVRRASPLDLLEKVYQAPCETGDGAKPRWVFVGDGPLQP